MLGVLVGLAATAFIKGLHRAEMIFERIRNPYIRHATGMLGVGILIYGLSQGFGHYFVEGVGYATVQDVLLGGLATAPLLGLLFVCKLTATSLSLGSGSSGGIFSPSLFMGATLGGAFGALAAATFPTLNLSVPAFAIIGMAAMVGGGTGAAMTAVTMIFEMTRDYDIVMPMIIAVAVKHWYPPHPFAREYLYDQASEPAPLYSEGAACKHVPCQSGPGCDGSGYSSPAAECELRRLSARVKPQQ